MPKQNANIRTIADFNATENDSPNVRSIPYQQSSSYEGMANINNNFNYNNDTTRLSGAASISTNSTSLTTTPNVYHIPRLHNDAYAKQLLHRVVQEFLPILQRRQYNVISISELCCCNDGLDFQHELDNMNGNTEMIHQPPITTKVKRRGRKIRKVADNIWGYNRTTFGYGNNRKQHTIHIRLRHTNDHSKFLLYEDVAGTLAHELSHCEYGPHDAKFFKLMDDILEEHANLMYNHLTTAKTSTAVAVATGTTPFSGTGQKLGSGVRPRFDNDDGTNSAATAAATAMGTKGQVLGGDRTFVQWMLPKDAAVIAAETRRRQQLLRLRGDHDCCRPCYDDDDDDDDERETNIKSDTIVLDTTTTGFHNVIDRNVTVKNEMVESRFGIVNFIDLTELDDDTYIDECHNDTNPWNCHRCTYRNQTLSLVCDMCSTTRRIFRSDHPKV